MLIPETAAASATMRRNFWRGVWRVMKRKPSRMAGVVIVAGFAFMGAFGPMFYPDQLPRDTNALYAGAELAHRFGTDSAGHATCSRWSSPAPATSC